MHLATHIGALYLLDLSSLVYLIVIVPLEAILAEIVPALLQNHDIFHLTIIIADFAVKVFLIISDQILMGLPDPVPLIVILLVDVIQVGLFILMERVDSLHSSE